MTKKEKESSKSDCVADIRKSILIREITKVNNFSVMGRKHIKEFFRV